MNLPSPLSLKILTLFQDNVKPFSPCYLYNNKCNMVFFLVRSFAADARLGPSADRRCTEVLRGPAVRPVTQQMRKRTTKKRKIAQELTKSAPFLQIFTKKSQKMPIFTEFTLSFSKGILVTNLPLCENPNPRATRGIFLQKKLVSNPQNHYNHQFFTA